LRDDTGAWFMRCEKDQQVALYHAGNKKLDTTSTGIDVTGTVTCDGLTTGNNQDITIGGVLKGSDTTFSINTNTSDGSDSSRVRINGGGGNGTTRGAQLELQGNEHSFGGDAYLTAGNSTGAILTLDAPHSSGYITLSSVGTERMRIDSNGKIFMNEGLPFAWTDSSLNVSADIYGDSSDNLVFRNTSAKTERMRIDSAGRVTMPYQPAFSVTSSSSDVTISSGSHTAIFNSEKFDIGGNFNTSSYRFTAPVAGRYCFSVAIQVDSGASGAHPHAMGVFFRKNGSIYTERYQGREGSTTYMSVTNTDIIDLSVNDYVDVEIKPHTTLSIEYSGGIDRCKFSGHLIG